jgi:hypothetical protein
VCELERGFDLSVSPGFSILLPPLSFLLSIELFISALIHTRGVGKRNHGTQTKKSPSFFLQQFFIVLEGKEPDVTFVLGGGKCRGRHTA